MVCISNLLCSFLFVGHPGVMTTDILGRGEQSLPVPEHNYPVQPLF
jgi:hypothetical protein